MKGVIIKCLQELVEHSASADTWRTVFEDAGLPASRIILAGGDVPDAEAMAIVKAAMKTLNLTLEQAGDAFGEFWITTYAPRVYGAFFKTPKNAREFLLQMDSVHKRLTETIPNAKPPRFDPTWKDANTLIMNYNSSRGMIDFAVGLARGVGKHFNERLTIRKLSDHQFEVRFLS